MLIGAYVGMKRKTMVYNPMSDFIKMISCLFVFYGVQYSAKINPIIAPYQIITLLPLVGIVFYFYKWCNAGFWGKVSCCNNDYIRSLFGILSHTI